MIVSWLVAASGVAAAAGTTSNGGEEGDGARACAGLGCKLMLDVGGGSRDRGICLGCELLMETGGWRGGRRGKLCTDLGCKLMIGRGDGGGGAGGRFGTGLGCLCKETTQTAWTAAAIADKLGMPLCAGLVAGADWLSLVSLVYLLSLSLSLPLALLPPLPLPTRMLLVLPLLEYLLSTEGRGLVLGTASVLCNTTAVPFPECCSPPLWLLRPLS